MKTLLWFVAAALLFGTVTSSSQARDAVSVDFFYDNLEPHGNWREVGGYGYCWQPRDVGPDWRPYSDGRWVYTDAGWTWDSNESFGWAVYHYGRWVDVNRVGWVWVPGTEWGPGWVSWRHSPQHTGWAPLPPEARLLLAVGLSSWVDNYYDIGPSHYRFVENRNFGARRLNTVFIDQSRNVSIINQTTNITNIRYVNNVVYNGGPVYDQQLRQSREPIQRYRLDRREDFDGNSRRQSPEYLRSRIDGDSMSVLALPFTGRSASAPRQLGERVERAEVNHGWRNAGTPDEIAAMRERMKSKERAPERLPPPNAFVKVTDEAAVREERRPDERPTMPGERPSKSKGKGEDRPGRPDMPPTVPQGQPRPGDRPPTDAPKGKGSDRPGRPDMPPSATERPTRPGSRPSGDAPKGKGTDKPMAPGFPERQIRPGDRSSTDAPKGKGADKPGRPDMPPSAAEKPLRPGDRPPDDAPKVVKPGRPDMPPTSAEKPNRGGRNKIEAPQLPRSESRPPTTVMPKGRDRDNVPQIAPPKPRPVPEKPRVAVPKKIEPRTIPTPKAPQVIKPAPSAAKPPTVVPTKPERPRGKGKPGDRKKKDD
jgi:hypothetical protein